MLSSAVQQLRSVARSNVAIFSASRFNSTSAATASTSLASSSSTAPAEAKAALRTTHYRVTLRRSAIGLPERTSLVLRTLGLRKRLQSVYKPHHPKFAGMILAVKELVHVENVRRLDGGLRNAAKVMAEQIRESTEEGGDADDVAPLIIRNQHATWVNEKDEVVDWGGRPARKAPRGYTVVGNMVNEQRHREIQMTKSTSQEGV